jgi:hypothetical protein
LKVSPTHQKWQKALDLTKAVLVKDNAETLMARELAQGMGLLNHLAEVDISPRRMLHPIWSDMNRAEVYSLWQHHPGADARVNLCERSRRNLGRWVANSEVPPFRPLMVAFGPVTAWEVKSEDYLNSEQLAKDGKIYVYEADASSLHGWSYHCCRDARVISGTWPPEHRDKSINWKELWTIVELVRRESVQLWGWRVLVRSDNSAAVHYVNIRYGGVRDLEALAVQLDHWEQQSGGLILSKHLPGKSNVIADVGSRSSDFEKIWFSDTFRDACLRPKLFAQIEADLGQFDLDLFSDREGRVALTKRWCCPESSAFVAQLHGSRCWAHPPRALISKFLEFVADAKKKGEVKVAVLIPCDAGAPWF